MIALFDLNGKLKPFVTKKIANKEVVSITSYPKLKFAIQHELDNFEQFLINIDTLEQEEIDQLINLVDTPNKQIKILVYNTINGIASILNNKIFHNTNPNVDSKKVTTDTDKLDTSVKNTGNHFEHICIGVSTGGPATLEMVIPQFPADIDVSIVVIQHMLRGNYIYNLCERLDSISQIKVKVAEDGEILKKGVAYFPPPGKHAYYRRRPNKEVSIHLTDNYPKDGSSTLFEPGHRFIHIPSIDIGMESASDVFGDKLVSTILTGMGSDGALALKYSRDNGAQTLSESQETCVVYGMPKVAFEKGGSMQVLKHYLIPNRILEIIGYHPK